VGGRSDALVVRLRLSDRSARAFNRFGGGHEAALSYIGRGLR
jgi:hypothetical protein